MKKWAMAARGWFVSWNSCHKFGRDNQMCICSLWSAGDTASLLSPSKLFPCFSRRGKHLSPRVPALLELPKTVQDIAGKELVAERAEGTRASTKATSIVLCGSCADSDGNSERILSSDGDSCALGKWHEAVKLREGRSTKYDVRHFLFVLLWRCDWLFAVKFHTMNVTVTVAMIFAVVWLPP